MDELLNQSHYYATQDGILFKSCPSCSVKAGALVFYRYEEFGERKRENGDTHVQSWCLKCRSERTQPCSH